MPVQPRGAADWDAASNQAGRGLQPRLEGPRNTAVEGVEGLRAAGSSSQSHDLTAAVVVGGLVLISCQPVVCAGPVTSEVMRSPTVVRPRTSPGRAQPNDESTGQTVDHVCRDSNFVDLIPLGKRRGTAVRVAVFPGRARL